MKNLEKNQDPVCQNERKNLKSRKHETNLQKNTTLYFQVGLILCLLASYAALEMRFEKTEATFFTGDPMEEELVEYAMKPFEVYVEPVKKVQPKVTKQKIIITDQIKVVENGHKDVIETLNLVTKVQPTATKKVLDPNAKELIIEAPEEDFNIMSVQTVPVYPGCERETDNAGRRKCMSEKIGKLIRKKFNSDVAENLGLSSGTNKIDVFFKINKEGNVEILKTRAPHARLEKEAKRVINKIPTMKPGMNNDRPVNVTYSVPIKVNVQD